jgi:hypothetical protein
MLTKLKREVCLQAYPNFPLRHYDEISDEEEYYYPEVYATHWLKLNSTDKEERTEDLAQELTGLINSLGYSQIIFLGDTEQNWISDLGLEHNDYDKFNQAKQYLTANNIDHHFNGGVQVAISELPEFIRHFYCLTSCDSTLPYFHFMDPEQNIIGFIHYSGEVRIDRMNRSTEELFKKVIADTMFLKVPTKVN